MVYFRGTGYTYITIQRSISFCHPGLGYGGGGEGGVRQNTDSDLYTDKKENQIFLLSKEMQRRSVAKSYMTNSLLSANIRLNICAFPHIHVLGSPSSYMTLQPIPSEFPYIETNFVFFFYQWQRLGVVVVFTSTASIFSKLHQLFI
jgi:hypothetical protein